MESFFKGLLWLFLMLLGSLVLFCAYIFYDANQSSDMKLLNKKLDPVIAEGGRLPSKNDINQWQHDFILKILIRGLPKLMTFHSECIESLRKELELRSLAISDISLRDQQGKDVIDVLSWHITMFRMKSQRVVSDMGSVLFPYDKKTQTFHVVNKDHAIPEKFFFEALNKYVHYARCLPDEYVKIIDDNIEHSRLTMRKMLLARPLAGLSSFDNPIYFQSSFLGYLLRVKKDQKLGAYKAIVSHNRVIEDYMRTGISQRNYAVFADKLSKTKREIEAYLKESNHFTKNNEVALENKNNKPKKSYNVYEAFKKMSQEEKDKVYKGFLLFSNDITTDTDSLLDDMMALEIDTIEYNVKRAVILIKNTSHFFKDSIYDVLQFNKNDTEKEVVSKVSYVIKNLDKFVKKEEIVARQSSQSMSRAEARQLESLMTLMSQADQQ